jgi:hypothetical protein
MRDADSLSLEARSSHGRSLRHPGSDPDVAAAAADVASIRDGLPVNPRTVRRRKRVELAKEVMVYELAWTICKGKQRRCIDKFVLVCLMLLNEIFAIIFVMSEYYELE